MVLRPPGALRPRVFEVVTEEIMAWTKPKFVEVACGMEVTRYAPADGGEPILF
jgi:coenzyme PQQ precursor peptide PqqA